MKKIVAVILLSLSTSVFADRPFDCNEQANTKSAVACNQNTLVQAEFASVPSPDTFALMALGLTGLIISRKKRK